MKKLKLFKPSDFLALEINDREPIGVLFAQSAEIANQILADYLEKNAVRAYRRVDRAGRQVWVYEVNKDGRETHRGLLINIEPIETKCENHEPVISGEYSSAYQEAWNIECYVCGAKLEATEWREVK